MTYNPAKDAEGSYFAGIAAKKERGDTHDVPESFLDDRVKLYRGDCMSVLAALPENSVDAVVTDPPYHLTSGKKGGTGEASLNLASLAGRSRVTTGGGFMGKQWDGGDIAFQPATWAAVLRVLKPGGYLLAFASTRGIWRMGVAIEDAGFISHPMIAWVFGSGFPKATRIKAEGYDGFRYGGQALKPAIEPIYMGQKPFSEATGTANILKWGTGAVNIASCRITSDAADQTLGLSPALQLCGLDGLQRSEIEQAACSIAGTIPSRIDAHADCILSTLSSWAGCGRPQTRQSPNGVSCAGCSSAVANFPVDCPSCCRSRDELLRHAEAVGLWPSPSQRGALADTAHSRKEWSRIHSNLCSAHRANWGDFLGSVSYDTYIQRPPENQYIPNGKNAVYGDGMGGGRWNQSPLGRWPANLIHDGSEEVLAGFPETATGFRPNQSTAIPNNDGVIWGHALGAQGVKPYDDSGSAARFFYSAKADATDRIGSKHPTVKPLDLMQYLCRLITPPGGTVLDLFAGTGTTGEAAWREGFRAILIEREPEYQQDIERRMELALKPAKRAAVAKTRNKLQGAEGTPLFGGTSEVVGGGRVERSTDTSQIRTNDWPGRAQAMNEAAE